MGLDMFYNKKVTLFNHFLDQNDEEHYVATLLDKADIVVRQSNSKNKAGIDSSSEVTLFVSFDNMPKEYKEPIEWLALADKSQYMTFNPSHDFFVKGDFTGETVTENFFEKMKQSHANVFVVTGVTVYDNILKHYEIGGK